MAFPALTKLFDRYLAMFPEGLVASPVFTDQTSPSERRRDQNHIWWQPTEQSPVVNFERIEAALERPIHPTIQSYFRSYWAGPLYCTFNGKPVELIQLWNPEEFEHLIENVVGHFCSNGVSSSHSLFSSRLQNSLLRSPTASIMCRDKYWKKYPGPAADARSSLAISPNF